MSIPRKAILWVLVSAAALPARLLLADDRVVWSVDRTSVMVGGCLTITLDADTVRLSSIRLLIDGEPVGRTLSSAPFHRQSGKMYVLVWVNLYPNEPPTNNAPRLNIPPVFEEPGTFELSLRGESVEDKVVRITVEALAPEAEPALELLFPRLVPGSSDMDERLKWSYLVGHAGEPWGTGISNLEWPADEVEALLRHPDWAEVVPVLLARWRLGKAEYERRVAYYKSKATPSPTDEYQKKIDACVQELCSVKTTSAFARALQAQVEDRLEQRKKRRAARASNVAPAQE